MTEISTWQKIIEHMKRGDSMKFAQKTAIVLCVAILASAVGVAQDNPLQAKVNMLMDSLQVVEANVFAPEKYEKAERAMEKAQLNIQKNRKPSLIEERLNEAAQYAELGLSTTATGKVTLAEYLEPREKAKAARAPMLAPDLYEKAEAVFIEATGKVESGDVKGGLKKAAETKPLFDAAEMAAIRADIMGTADALILKAGEGEAEKYAPSTLDKARTSRAKCDAILSTDRYERKESIAAIRRSEYEARHALDIATRVRSLERNDQAWEKIMLAYEIEMNRAGEAAEMDLVPFDKGPGVAADSLVAQIGRIKSRAGSSSDLNRDLEEKLGSILSRFGVTPSGSGPMTLADQLDGEVADLLTKDSQLLSELNSEKERMSQLMQEHEQVAAELEQRTDQEQKFKQAKALLNPSEGEVLFNASNDLVLRLSGLSFDVNSSEIKDEHVPLLEKVETVIKMYPDAKLIVEGHTDASGDPAVNTDLSQKRAYAVMQYLRESMLLSADRISAIGYGSDKPVASNKTPEGRAKNRRIDIIIMQ